MLFRHFVIGSAIITSFLTGCGKENVDTSDLIIKNSNFKLQMEDRLDFGVLNVQGSNNKEKIITVKNIGNLPILMDEPISSHSSIVFKSKENFNNPIEPNEERRIVVSLKDLKQGSLIHNVDLSKYVYINKNSIVDSGVDNIHKEGEFKTDFINYEFEETDGSVDIVGDIIDIPIPIIETNVDNFILDFGNVTNKITKTITLKNVGNKDADISSIEIISSDNSFKILNKNNLSKTIHQGETISLDIEADLNYLGNATACLVIKSNSLNSPIEITLLGKKVSNLIEVSTDGLIDFKSKINSLTTREFTIRNLGNERISINSLNVSGNGFSLKNNSSNRNITIEPGSSITKEIEFKPSSPLIYTGILEIDVDHNKDIIKHKYNLLGEGTAPIISLINSINFGRQELNKEETSKFYITNTGKDRLIINNITASNYESFSYNFNNCLTSLNQGETCYGEVTFNPQKIGKITSDIKVSSNSINGDYSFVISGIGSRTDLVHDTDIDFGYQNKLVTKNINFTNISSNQVSIKGFTLEKNSNFKVNNSDCLDKTLNLGNKCSVSISFDPTINNVKNTFEDILSINYLVDGFDKEITSYANLYGNSNGASLDSSVDSTNTIDFNFQEVGQKVVKKIHFENVGKSHLLMKDFQIKSTDNVFRIIENTCSELNTEDTCYINIESKPITLGTFSGELKFTTNERGNNQYRYSILTKAVKSGISLNKNSIDFGNVSIHQDSQIETMELLNTGDNPITITNIVSDVDDFKVINNSCLNKLINVGSTCSFQVKVNSSKKDRIKGNITIENDSYSSPIKSIEATANIIYADFSLNREVIDFGNVSIGRESLYELVTIFNKGNKNLDISNITSSNKDFEIINNSCIKSLSVDEMCSFQVKVKSEEKNKINSDIKIISNSDFHKDKVIKSVANITYVEIFTEKDQFEFDFSSHENAVAILVKNHGNDLLDISSIEVSNINYVIDDKDSCINNLISKEDQCHIIVSTKYDNKYAHNGELTIISNDSFSKIKTIKLKGILKNPTD